MVAFKDPHFRPNVQAAGIAKPAPSCSASLFVDEGIMPFAKPVVKKAQVTIKAIKYPNMPSIMPKKVIQVEENGHIYEEGIELKDARFGKVHRIYRLQRVEVEGRNEEVYMRSEEKLAVKKLHKRSILYNREKAENPLHEIAALQLLASVSSSVPYVDCFADSETIYLITPYYNSGDLLDLIFYKQNLSQSFSISEMKEMFTQLVHQLLRLHSMGIVHRDLSLENILYDKDTKQYTIIDYGMSLRLKDEIAGDDSDAMAASNEEKESSILIDSDESTTTSTSASFTSSMYDRFSRLSNYVICGKQHYIAPEIWEHRRDLELMYSDVWSLGVVFFMVMMFQAPFASAKTSDANYNFFLHHNQSLDELIMQLNGDESIYSTKPAEEHKQYEQLIDLMGRMLKPNHHERLTIEEVFQHTFFQ